MALGQYASGFTLRFGVGAMREPFTQPIAEPDRQEQLSKRAGGYDTVQSMLSGRPGSSAQRDGHAQHEADGPNGNDVGAVRAGGELKALCQPCGSGNG